MRTLKSRMRLASYSLPYSNPKREPVDRTKLGPFVNGYIKCALWSSSDPWSDSDESLEDLGYTKHDIHEPTLLAMIRDCAYFYWQNRHLLERAYTEGYEESQAGHDFWLSRNEHGAGFFDHCGWDSDDIWDKLHHFASHRFAPFTLWVNEDNEVAADLSETVQKMNRGVL